MARNARINMRGNKSTRPLSNVNLGPTNGQQRVDSSSGVAHLQVFFNGSWMHDHRCKKLTNPKCQK